MSQWVVTHEYYLVKSSTEISDGPLVKNLRDFIRSFLWAIQLSLLASLVRKNDNENKVNGFVVSLNLMVNLICVLLQYVCMA